MPRLRTGCIRERNGKVYAVVSFTDPVTGKRRFRERKAKNRRDARRMIDAMLKELDETGARSFVGGVKTFSELADWYRDTYLIPPEYRDGVKVAGLRSWEDMRRRLRVLVEYFGLRPLRGIAFGDLEKYRSDRLAKPKERGGGKRSLAAVHRELEILRRMFAVAVREGWMPQNPFQFGSKTLISQASEATRARIITPDEEARLLAACDTPQRRHLRAFLLFLIDTGARRNEALQLRWKNVNLTGRAVTLEKVTTKTNQERPLPLSKRLADELERLYFASTRESDAFVFPVRNPRTAFENARDDAGLPWLRLHDLRHCFATRLVTGGLPMAMAAHLLGHARLQTTLRYANLSREAVEQATAILDKYHDGNGKDDAAADELVN